MKSKNKQDNLDWKILALLQQNARLTNTEIGKQVGLSPPAVTARIRRLEDGGVIEGYAARINPKALGRDISALMRLRAPHAALARCLKAFDRTPEILEVYRITGEDCFVAKGTFARMADLERTIDVLSEFGSVTTSIILASYHPKSLTN
jgi:Lrp/AsnC family leucine-responsive transcriptional regulator